MMNNSQQTKEPQDQVLFTVDAETFRQFCELLDAPVKDNPGLARLMTENRERKTAKSAPGTATSGGACVLKRARPETAPTLGNGQKKIPTG